MDLVIVESQNETVVVIQQIEAMVDRFIADQDVKETSKLVYRRTLKQYFAWVALKNYNLSLIARPELLQYKEDLLAAGKSSLTVGSYITSVRRFYEWAEANKLYPNVAKGIKSPRRKQQFKKQPLQPAQATSLLDHYAASSRDNAIINLLLRTGLRTIEVVRANVEDITYKGCQRVLMVHGKGRDEKDNFVVLTEKTYAVLNNYLSTRGRISQGPLFISASNKNLGGRLSTRMISLIAKTGLRSIGLDDKSFTAHSLRHTTAINILRAGGTMENAQFTLRHSSPATTQIYTATLNEERRLQNSGEALLDSMY